MANVSILPPPILPPDVKKKDFSKTPQELVSEFWDKFFTKKPGKVTSIFPRSLYATLIPPSQHRGVSSARNAAESYEAAAKECAEKVRRIVRECNRTNEKYTDPDFDIESDAKNNCLNGLVRDLFDSSNLADSSLPVTAGQLHGALDTLVNSQVLGPEASVPVNIAEMRNFIGSSSPWAALLGSAAAASSATASDKRVESGPKEKGSHGVKAGETYWPGSVHRVDWIFDSPKFTIDGYSSSDIMQGSDGDCWWLAAVATIAHRRDLMDKVCVARDEECGVYGFVFHRDGDWVSTVVDDNLFLRSRNFDFYEDTYDSTGKRAREHRKQNQTGSEALYFARCADPNETWLPLLEKAYAKIHGDYEAISGGWSGEAVEDMTGGVTTTVATNRVLKKDRLWKELVNSDNEFVFALSAIGTGWDWQKGGLALGHAYSVLKATEEVDEDGKKVRLVLIRNPWGERAGNGIGEWNGPWSDGSKEWTPYWLKKLNHTFGDDGLFWMDFDTMLDTFLFLHRTRLFDEKWTIVQQWASVNVGWVSGFLTTKFSVEIKKAGMVVIVLTQLDDRYFRGLEGQYRFELHFLLQKEDGKEGEHICRVRPVHSWENRSVSCEVELEPGRYEVLPKITTIRDKDAKMVEDVVRDHAEKNPQKLRQVGMQYDVAHAKGGVPDEDDLLLKRQEEAKKKQDEKKRKRKERAKRQKVKIEVATDESAQITIKAGTKEGQGDTAESKDDDKFEDAVEEKSNVPDTTDQVNSEKPVNETNNSVKDSVVSKQSVASKGIEAPSGKRAENKEQSKTEDDEDDEDTSDEETDEESASAEEQEAQPPWNAVCVVGLRVYSKDSGFSISVVKPKDPQEGASLTVDGQLAGATA